MAAHVISERVNLYPMERTLLYQTTDDLTGFTIIGDDGRKYECQPGSVAYTADLGHIRILNINGEWVEFAGLGKGASDKAVPPITAISKLVKMDFSYNDIYPTIISFIQFNSKNTLDIYETYYTYANHNSGGGNVDEWLSTNNAACIDIPIANDSSKWSIKLILGDRYPVVAGESYDESGKYDIYIPNWNYTVRDQCEFVDANGVKTLVVEFRLDRFTSIGNGRLIDGAGVYTDLKNKSDKLAIIDQSAFYNIQDGSSDGKTIDEVIKLITSDGDAMIDVTVPNETDPVTISVIDSNRIEVGD